MEKRKWFLIFVFAFVFVFSARVYADDSLNINKAIKCLDDQIESSSSLSLDEAIFSYLSGNSDDKVLRTIRDSKDSAECWPKGSCRIKETAQVALAKKRNGEDITKILTWLLSKSANTNEIAWYLQITVENNAPAECNVVYDGQTKGIKIDNNLRLSGDTGSCLSISPTGYRLRVSNSCLDKEYSFSCNESFKTNILYEKESGGITYVTSFTHGAAPKGVTKEKIVSKCFKTGNECDYEGSIWAASLLESVGNDSTPYRPYLAGMASSNGRYFPSAFLYDIAGESRSQDYYSDIMNKQKPGGFWDIEGSPYNKYYDTSLAIMAIGGIDSSELSSTKSFIFDTQTEKGCWNNENKRDTAFIIYASAWLRSVGGSSGGGIIPGETNDSNGSVSYDPDEDSRCAESGYYCVSDSQACTEGLGTVLNNYECELHNQKCCTVPVLEKTCYEKGGTICASDEDCTIGEIPSSDGSCCLDECQEKTEEEIPEEEEDTPSPIKEEESGRSWVWIFLLLVLILAVVAGIMYRNKLRMWLFSKKGRGSPAKPSGVNLPPSTGPRQLFGGFQRPRGVFDQQRTRVAQPRFVPGKSVKDKEMEETLKKLKDMSK